MILQYFVEDHTTIVTLGKLETYDTKDLLYSVNSIYQLTLKLLVFSHLALIKWVMKFKTDQILFQWYEIHVYEHLSIFTLVVILSSNWLTLMYSSHSQVLRGTYKKWASTWRVVAWNIWIQTIAHLTISSYGFIMNTTILTLLLSSLSSSSAKFSCRRR